VTEALASGLLLGLSCGLSPGPLMALLLMQTLRHGAREGCKVACVPLLTDAPIILVALAFAAHATQAQKAFGLISFAGGAFLLFLAAASFRPVRVDTAALEPPRSLVKGSLVNLLSPYPWLFWLTIGVTSLAQAMHVHRLAVLVFLAAFYLALVGSKILVALMASHSRQFLQGRAYRVVMAVLGVLLVVFALMLLRQGYQYLCG
jgi:threonine/homoserine/homoserine lactone efflux protein